MRIYTVKDFFFDGPPTWLDKELKTTENTNIPFSIIYFDIDYFKKINDVYGYDISNQILNKIEA